MCKFTSNQIIEGIHTAVDFDNEYYKELFNQEDYNSHEFALCQFVATYKSPYTFINSDTNTHCNENPILRKHKNL
ncbi:7338_t:CDS:2, partial [Funneliformis geosporum]